MSNIWKKLFIPHEHNNHRAWLIQPSFVGVFIALYLLNQSFIKSFTIIRPGVLGYSSEITTQKVLDLTNLQRQKYGQPPLKYNPTLSQSATAKAKDMFANNYWSHTSPSGTTPWDFFLKSGYEYSIAGENLAKDFYDTDTMMRAWINSPTHKANIINSKYQEIGVGVVDGVLNGVKTTLVVQHFGTPIAASVKVLSEVDNSGGLTPVTQVTEQKGMLSPLVISQVIGSILFIIIMSALIIDIYISLKNKTHRLAGNSYGHVGFIAIIFLLLIATRSGAIF